MMGLLSPRLGHRFLAAFLAALIAIEPAAAAISESFWNERRSAAPANRRLEVAGLPAPSLHLLGQPPRSPLPAVRPGAPASSLNPLESAVASLPWSLGRAGAKAIKGAGRVVVHIQDIHLNAEAQKNIGGALIALLPHTGAVALEGEWGPLRLDGFQDPKRRDHVRRVADHLFRSQLLDGPLHALLTSRARVPVSGADEGKAYEANAQAYRDAIARKPAAARAHALRRAVFEKEAEAVLSPALRSLDRSIAEYHAGRRSLADHLEGLTRHARRVPPAVSDFLTASRLEGSIDLDRTAVERRRLIEELSRQLSPGDVQELIDRSVAYRTGADSAAAFYSFLETICGRCGVKLGRYPAMSAYLSYVLLADRVDPAALQQASLDLERAAVTALSRTAAEKRVVEAGRLLRLEEKLLAFALSPEEWRAYRGERGQNPELRPFESFYVEAERRDGAMAARVGRMFAEQKVSAIVLVTGGFHTAGLRERLEKSGIRVIDWTPRITRVDLAEGSRALDVFAQEKTPLEGIFRGRTLFLAPRPTRALSVGAAAVVALNLMLPASAMTPLSPLSEYNELVPGARATEVSVSGVSPRAADVTVQSDQGAATVHVEAGTGDELVVRQSAANAPAAMLPTTAELGRALGLTAAETAVRIAPTYELPHTLFDYAVFLVTAVLTLGLVRTDYFLDLHDHATPQMRTDRARGVLSIRIWSTAALVLSVAAVVGIQFLAGGAIGQLGSFGPIVHVSIGAVLVVPSIAYAQVRAHRAYNRWAVTQAGKPTLVLPGVESRDGEALAIAESEGRVLQQIINHYNAVDGWRSLFGGVLVFPAHLLPANFVAPAEGDIAEAWWDQANVWFSPYFERAHDMMAGPNPAINVPTAQMQSQIIGQSLAGQTVLEIGVGVGNTMLAISALGAAVINAIDADPVSVDRATRNVSLIANSAAQFHVRRDDATRLATVADDSIDTATLFATAVYVLPGLRPRMFRRIFDVLKGGGRLIMLEFPSRGPAVADGMDMAWSGEQWQAALEAAGFQVKIQTFENNGAFYLRIVADKPGKVTEAAAPAAKPPTPPAESRAVIADLTNDEERFVAAVAHAYASKFDDVVPPEAVEEARKIIFGQSPLPADLWTAARAYFIFKKETGFKKFLRDLAAQSMTVDQSVAMFYFDGSDASSTLNRVEEDDRQNALLRAVVAEIDTREERAVMPAYLRAARIAVHSSTKGNYDVKDGLPKTRNEDFGLRHILPDGSIIVFTGDGMGGYGHGDQAAQLAAAGFYLSLLKYWKAHVGDDAALTDVRRLAPVFRQAVAEARAAVERSLTNTSAGVVFDVFFAHPHADGRGWFFANYHRGDSRTEIGEPGKSLRVASIDNVSSGVPLTMDEIQALILNAPTFRLLRSVMSHDDLVHDWLSSAYKRRSMVTGGLIEGRVTNEDLLSYGELPVGAWALQSTDGRLDPLTEAAAGRIVAGSVALEAVPRNLTAASQPTLAPGEERPHVFRAKADDALNQVIELGPLSSFTKAGEDDEAALVRATDLAEQALEALLKADRATALRAFLAAEAIVTGIYDQGHVRVASTLDLVRSVGEIITNTATYFVAGERLLRDGADIGFVVDDGNLIPGKLVLLNDASRDSDTPQEHDRAVIFSVVDRDPIAGALGQSITRDTPGDDYFDQRRRIGGFNIFLKEAKKRGISAHDGMTLAQVKADVVNKRFPNGSAVVGDGRSFIVVDNGAAADAILPGFSIVYFNQIDQIGVLSHSRLIDQIVETIALGVDVTRVREGAVKLARVFAESGGLTLEAQRTRAVDTIEGVSWKEFGQNREEIRAAKEAGEATLSSQLAALKTGDVIVTRSRGTLVVIDEASNPAIADDEILIYELGDGRLVTWFRIVGRNFFTEAEINEIRPATDDLVRQAGAVRDYIRELTVQPGKSISEEVDERPWDQVMPAEAERLAGDQSSGGMIPALRRWLEPLFVTVFGERTGRMGYRRGGAPLLEEAGAFTTIPLLIGWTLAGAGLDPALSAGLFLVAFAAVRLAFVYLHPAGARGAPWRISAFALALAAPIAIYFWFSPMGLALALGAAIAAHAAVNTVTDHHARVDRALEAAFPQQELLGLKSFTFHNLPLLGLSDARAAALAADIRARRAGNVRRLTRGKVQQRIVSRLAGERTALSAVATDRLALAAQGGSPERRALDRAMVDRLLGGAARKDVIVFIDGSNPDDRAFYGALASRSRGRVRVIEHSSPLIREGVDGRVLNLAALESALAAADGAWDGAAFVIPPDLSFDASGVTSSSLLRRLVFLFLDQTLRALPATAADLRHIDTFARLIAQQA